MIQIWNKILYLKNVKCFGYFIVAACTRDQSVYLSSFSPFSPEQNQIDSHNVGSFRKVEFYLSSFVNNCLKIGLRATKLKISFNQVI